MRADLMQHGNFVWILAIYNQLFSFESKYTAHSYLPCSSQVGNKRRPCLTLQEWQQAILPLLWVSAVVHSQV